MAWKLCRWFPRGDAVVNHGIGLLLQILLLVIFLQFFGLPAIQKYKKKDVMWVETIKDTDGIPLPAITLRFGMDASEKQQHRSCFNLSNNIADCLERNTPNVSMVLKRILLGYKRKKHIVLQENQIIFETGFLSRQQ